MNSYTLYKEYKTNDDFLFIIKYLYSLGYDFRPNEVVEENYPEDIYIVPSIKYGKLIYSGIDKVVKFYEDCTDFTNLREKAKEFNNKNPNYKIPKN